MMGTPLLPSGSQPPDVILGVSKESQSSRHARVAELKPQLTPAKASLAPHEPAARQALRARILSEFREMPGMSLTEPQAARLFGLSHDVCTQILDELAARGLLSHRVTGGYGLPPGSITRKAG